MPELANIEEESWIIIKGVGGRETLKTGLLTNSAKVTELAVYQRKLPDLMAQKQIASYNQNHSFWLITSIQALNNLWRILGKRSQKHRIIVSSDRIRQEAEKLGFQIVAQSADATDKQLIECIGLFIKNIQNKG